MKLNLMFLLLKQEAIQSRRQFKAGGNSKQEAIHDLPHGFSLWIKKTKNQLWL
jgi:hypothetical protein